MSYSKGEVILFPYPFTDLSTKKIRPAVVVGLTEAKYNDIFIVPLTSRTNNLGTGEHVLSGWQQAGLNVVSAVKRGCYLVDSELVLKRVGSLAKSDMDNLEKSLQTWLDLE
jgi:mRNA interferase MazF